MKQLVAGIVALAVAGTGLYGVFGHAHQSSAGLAPPGGKDHFTLGPASSISIELDGVEGTIVVPLQGTLYWERSDPHEPEPGVPSAVEQVIDITGGEFSAAGPASTAGTGSGAGPQDFEFFDEDGLDGQIWVQEAFGTVANGLGLNFRLRVQYTQPGEGARTGVTGEPLHFELFIHLPSDGEQLNGVTIDLPLEDPANPGQQLGIVRSIKVALEPTQAGPTATQAPMSTPTPVPTATETEEPLPGVDDTPEPTESATPSVPAATSTSTPTPAPETGMIWVRVLEDRGFNDFVGLEGWQVNVFEGDGCQGTPIMSGVTDSEGRYKSAPLPLGPYSVSQKLQPGYASLRPLCEDLQAGETTDAVPLFFFNIRPNGDVNNDGNTNSVDASLLLQFISGHLTNFDNELRADVNQDGVTNAVDAALILQLEAGLIDHLPVGGD